MRVSVAVIVVVGAPSSSPFTCTCRKCGAMLSVDMDARPLSNVDMILCLNLFKVAVGGRNPAGEEIV